MIEINPRISIDEKDIEFEFMRAGGPGGQNVNKVETAVRLRINIMRCETLPLEVRVRMKKLAGSRMDTEGNLLIVAREHRSQDSNKQEAVSRLVALVREALVVPKKRRETKPTHSSQLKRVETKRKHSQAKSLRKSPIRNDD